jgi:hypothetical protein
MPPRATSRTLPPPVGEPRGGSSPLIRIAKSAAPRGPIGAQTRTLHRSVSVGLRVPSRHHRRSLHVRTRTRHCRGVPTRVWPACLAHRLRTWSFGWGPRHERGVSSGPVTVRSGSSAAGRLPARPATRSVSQAARSRYSGGAVSITSARLENEPHGRADRETVAVDRVRGVVAHVSNSATGAAASWISPSVRPVGSKPSLR